MRRYKFLDKTSVYKALNKVRAAFLAAKDGNEVDEIIMGILTHDERMKIGRRVQIAEMIRKGLQYREISKNLKVGLTTVMLVAEKMQKRPIGYELIMYRENKMEKEYKNRVHQKVGGSKLVFKKKIRTGFKRRDVKR